MVCEAGLVSIDKIHNAIDFDQYLRLQVKHKKKERSRSKNFANTADDVSNMSRSKLSTVGDRSPFRNAASGIMGGTIQKDMKD